MTGIQAVIFDMDGTLIDTEKYYRRCWRRALREFGYQITEEQLLSLRSTGRPFALVRFQELFGAEFPYREVRARRQELVEACVRTEGIQQKPGVGTLLSFLKKQRIRTAVATASDPERTNRYLKLAGLEHCLDDLFSATMVERGKPAPDVYLYACGQLGLPPAACLAVEDSPNGVQSAWRAGCSVVMVPDQTPPTEELRPMLCACVGNLAEICGLFDAEAAARVSVGQKTDAEE